MQLVGGFIQEAMSSGSAAVAQSMCNAVLDIAVLFISPSPKLHEQLQQVLILDGTTAVPGLSLFIIESHMSSCSRCCFDWHLCGL